MSTREGLEPTHSPASDTHTQPLPRDQAAEAAGPRPDPAATGRQQEPAPADQPWPPSWGQPPETWGQPSAPTPTPQTTPPAATPGTSDWPAPAAAAGTPGWTPPPGAQGPSWTQPAGPDAAGTTQVQATGPDDGPRAQPPPPEGRADQTQPGWGQGGGGHPTVPGWGTRPADPGAPRDRRPSRWLAAAVAGIVLLASGYGLSQALDNDAQTPAGAGIPTAPVAAAPITPGEEPAAAVAKALLPTVVEIGTGTGAGSGFVYDRNGFIMTAAHVIEDAETVEVRLYDGTKLRGEVVGIDELNDVGVVKVDRTGLQAAPLGTGQTVQVGQLAIAIGSPFGLNETVTAGIVSSTDRVLPDGREVIQTDAPINPGNSGGVLADRRGRVIGINSAIRPANDGSNGNVGIGFAVPIDIAARSAAAIVRGEEIRIGYLGVRPADTAGGGRDGVLIQEVTPDSPASQAGLRPGDLVTRIDGQAVEDNGELVARIRAHKPGDKVTLTVVRGGQETTISATLTERPAG
jgi:putative serine protease PepD